MKNSTRASSTNFGDGRKSKSISFSDYLNWLLAEAKLHKNVHFILYYQNLWLRRDQTAQICNKFIEKNKNIKNISLCFGSQALWFHVSRLLLFSSKLYVLTREKSFIQKELLTYIKDSNIELTIEVKPTDSMKTVLKSEEAMQNICSDWEYYAGDINKLLMNHVRLGDKGNSKFDDTSSDASGQTMNTVSTADTSTRSSSSNRSKLNKGTTSI